MIEIEGTCLFWVQPHSAGLGFSHFLASAALSAEDFTDGIIDVVTLVFKSGLVNSKSEGRRAVEQGGVTVDGEKVVDIKQTFLAERFAGEGVVGLYFRKSHPTHFGNGALGSTAVLSLLYRHGAEYLLSINFAPKLVAIMG